MVGKGDRAQQDALRTTIRTPGPERSGEHLRRQLGALLQQSLRDRRLSRDAEPARPEAPLSGRPRR